MNLRSLLYSLARLLGDAQAVQRGPSALLQRLMRKQVHRRMGNFINRLFK